MSDIIRLLPDSVANQIAAGEVIQRPASVIKELVENSVDAGAHRVSIVLRDAGRTLIQVVDDGSGMSDIDARLAFERHATSKIAKADDLFTLRTMGFRGEALASIAAIAQLEVRTMQRGQSVGTRLEINGSVVQSQAPEACAPGTSLAVKNLFFNVPARRKFLKKDTVELANILREFERLALVNPDVEFTITHNGSTLHSLRRGSMKQRIGELFGKTVERQLLPVETDTSIVRLTGFVSSPEHARKRNPLQYLMVNGRNMRHPYFHKAILQCYEGLIAPDVQPNYFIMMTVDPQTIDVNIHPTKNEIKFENEQAIWQIMTAAIKEGLGRFNGVPGIDFEAVDVPDLPAFDPTGKAAHGRGVNLDIDTGYNPFDAPAAPPAPRVPVSGRNAPMEADGADEEDWEKLYETFSRRRAEGLSQVPVADGPGQAAAAQAEREAAAGQPGLGLEASFTPSTVLQVAATFVLTPVGDGVMVIDQHRAHYTVLEARYQQMLRSKAMAVQSTMFPEAVQLSASQQAVMQALATRLGEVGFEVADEGGGNWQITGTPAALEGVDTTQLLLEMVEGVTDSGQEMGEAMKRDVARLMARRAAIKPGRYLSREEMNQLVSDLFSLPAPARDPEGRRVFEIITTDYLTKLLG